jgi:hypothetical protein
MGNDQLARVTRLVAAVDDLNLFAAEEGHLANGMKRRLQRHLFVGDEAAPLSIKIS